MNCRPPLQGGRLEGDARNALHLLFADADHIRMLVDWEAVAQSALAMFRVDYGRHVGDPGFERLVERLSTRSAVFAGWWRRREVRQPVLGHKRIDHLVAGRMLFEYASFGVGDHPDLKLIVFTPLAEADTAARLDRLLRGVPA